MCDWAHMVQNSVIEAPITGMSSFFFIDPYHVLLASVIDTEFTVLALMDSSQEHNVVRCGLV